MARHETVPVTWKGQQAQIDKGIAPLIREIWKAGIATLNSCEENRPGWVWIQFEHSTEAERFLNIVAQYDEGMDTLYNRIRQEWVPMDAEMEGEWEYSVLPKDVAVEQTLVDDEYLEESCSGPSNFFFTLSIRFPRTDLPRVLERVEDHNRKAWNAGRTGGLVG